MSKKNNVIQFPTHRIKNPVPPVSEELLHELNVHEECIELGRFCIDLIENGLREYYGRDEILINLKDKDSPEYKDMFVMLNLFVAMFMRKAGLKHILQEDLYEVYMKLKVIECNQKGELDIDELDFEDDE
jgi:hypothetical protein